MLKVQPRVTFLRNDQNDAADDSIADNKKLFALSLFSFSSLARVIAISLKCCKKSEFALYS